METIDHIILVDSRNKNVHGACAAMHFCPPPPIAPSCAGFVAGKTKKNKKEEEARQAAVSTQQAAILRNPDPGRLMILLFVRTFIIAHLLPFSLSDSADARLFFECCGHGHVSATLEEQPGVGAVRQAKGEQMRDDERPHEQQDHKTTRVGVSQYRCLLRAHRRLSGLFLLLVFFRFSGYDTCTRRRDGGGGRNAWPRRRQGHFCL